MADPGANEVRYTTSRGVSLAWSAAGAGPDLVFVPNWATNRDGLLSTPSTRYFFERLSAHHRTVMYDQRGTGLSDRADDTGGIDGWVADLLAVLDAAGCERTVLFAADFSVPVAIACAARHPDRVSSLVLWGGGASLARTDRYAVGLPPELVEPGIELIVGGWGDPSSDFARLATPGDDPDSERAREDAARIQRISISPSAARRLLERHFSVDVTEEATAVSAPALIMHRHDDRLMPAAHAHALGALIPGARVLILPGADHYAFMADADRVLDAIDAFTAADEPVEEGDLDLLAVAFLDIVDSTGTATSLGDRAWTERVQRHAEATAVVVVRHGGRLVKHTGDGLLATFPLASAAVRCAMALRSVSRAAGLVVRCGVHVGEVRLRDDDVSGFVVHLAQRVESAAPHDGVAVTSTVRDVLKGSRIPFEDHGVHQLKGIDEPVHLFTVAG